MISVALFGIGRAGGEVVKEIATSGQFHLCAVFCRDGSPKAGQPVSSLLQIGELGVQVNELSQAPRVLEETKPDVCVDFSNHACAAAILSACAPQKIPCVLCTTGFAAEELEELSAFVQQNGMGAVYAPNVTLGVNVLIAAIKVVARALPDFDYRITETHHNKKFDKPSGTARVIADAIENELEKEDVRRYVPIHSIRAGGYIGLHEVLLANDCERLSFTHESFNRRAFARGALAAAKFVIGKTGWYGMQDVVNIPVSRAHAAVSIDAD